ncbi:MAG: hypothetical protein JF617_09785 [Burkholderiales bacterium]|nr:hypothetical protein [Burkholderiales bacterium]
MNYMQNTLDEIAQNFNTDKISGLHDFLKFYDRRLSHLRNEKFVLFEVGVLNGGSVKTWEAYFPNATIVGIDIDPRCKEFEAGNISIRIGDASRVDFLFDLIAEFGRPTVFVEDGSHRWDHQISIFQTMFPLVVPGGLYIMEDIDTSFQEHLEKAPFDGFSTISAVDYLFKLARVVVGERALKDEKPYDLFISNWASWVGSVDLGRRTSVISKKLQPQGGPI